MIKTQAALVAGLRRGRIELRQQFTTRSALLPASAALHEIHGSWRTRETLGVCRISFRCSAG